MGSNALSEHGFYGWINVFIASVFMFTITIMMQTFPLFLPEWINEFEWKYKDVSFALSINMVVMSFATPLVGIFISKYGSRLAIVVGSTITIIGIYFLSNIHSLWHLYLGNGIIVATGLSLGGILAVTTLMNNWFQKKRSLAISIPMAAMGVAGMVIAPTIPWMIINIGWRSTYSTIIPVYFVFALLIPGIFLRNSPQELGQLPDSAAELYLPENYKGKKEEVKISKNFVTTMDFTASEAFRTPTMWLLLVFNVLNWIAMGAIMAHGYSFLNDLGIPRVKAGLFMGIISGATVSGQLLVGFLGLKFDMLKMVMLGCSGIIISYILMVFAAYSIIIVYIYAVFGGMGLGINMVALMNLVPNYFGIKHYPRIMGFTLPIAILIGSTGAPLCGYIRDTTGSYTLFWKIAAIIMTVGLICLFFVRPPIHPSLKISKENNNN